MGIKPIIYRTLGDHAIRRGDLSVEHHFQNYFSYIMIFSWWKKTEYWEKTTAAASHRQTISHIVGLKVVQ